MRIILAKIIEATVEGKGHGSSSVEGGEEKEEQARGTTTEEMIIQVEDTGGLEVGEEGKEKDAADLTG